MARSSSLSKTIIFVGFLMLQARQTPSKLIQDATIAFNHENSYYPLVIPHSYGSYGSYGP
jgi:hypothetical protein